MVVRFQPMIEVNLIQIRGDQFLAQFVCLAAYEGHVKSGQRGNQELGDLVWIDFRVGLRGLHSEHQVRSKRITIQVFAANSPRKLKEFILGA